MGTVTGDFEVFDSWIDRGSELADLLRRSAKEQQNAGYFHTLREIFFRDLYPSGIESRPVSRFITPERQAPRVLDDG